VRPARRCSSVLLPDPLAPMTATNSPASYAQIEAAKHLDLRGPVAERLVQPRDLDGRGTRGFSLHDVPRFPPSAALGVC
jgi:hypothetical protein